MNAPPDPYDIADRLRAARLWLRHQQRRTRPAETALIACEAWAVLLADAEDCPHANGRDRMKRRRGRRAAWIDPERPFVVRCRARRRRVGRGVSYPGPECGGFVTSDTGPLMARPVRHSRECMAGELPVACTKCGQLYAVDRVRRAA